MKPYWPVEPPTASEGEDTGGVDKLRVETKVNVEMHQEYKLNHNGDIPQEKQSPASQPRSNRQPEQRRGEGGRNKGLCFCVCVCFFVCG